MFSKDLWLNSQVNELMKADSRWTGVFSRRALPLRFMELSKLGWDAKAFKFLSFPFSYLDE